MNATLKNDEKYNPQIIALFFRELLLYKRNILFLCIVSALCSLFIEMVSAPDKFKNYNDSLPIAVALSFADILIGILLSINMVCKDKDMIYRELRMGVSSLSLIVSKTLVNIVLCFIMTLILTISYILNLNQIAEQNTLYLCLAVFLTMLAAAELGLMVSSIPYIDSQKAVISIPFIILFNLLFSGFIFEQKIFIELDYISISSYSIKSIGSALRFDKFDPFDIPYGVFSNTLIYGVCYIFSLFIFFIVFMALSYLFLHFIDVSHSLLKFYVLLGLICCIFVGYVFTINQYINSIEIPKHSSNYSSSKNDIDVEPTLLPSEKYEQDNIDVILNGNFLLKIPAESINYTTMLPARKIIEALGANIEMVDEKTVIVSKGDKKIIFTFGSNIAIVDGIEVTLSEALVFRDGLAFIPYYALSEAIGYSCDFNLKTQTPTLSLTPISVSDITLNETTITLEEGTTKVLTKIVNPPNALDKSVTWVSDDVKIATVDNKGTVTAVSKGLTTITVTTEDKKYASTCTVNVNTKPIPVNNVVLNKNSLVITVGEIQTLQATINPTNASNKKVTWSSDNLKVATVDESGSIRAVSGGTAKISVTTEDRKCTAACVVKVKAQNIPTTKSSPKPPPADSNAVKMQGNTEASNTSVPTEVQNNTATSNVSGSSLKLETEQ